MSNDDYAWARYAELQRRSDKLKKLNDYSWGIESALDYLITAIQTDRIPPNPADLDATLNRAVASGARLRRSRSSALKKWSPTAASPSTSATAEANIDLDKIGRIL